MNYADINEEYIEPKIIKNILNKDEINYIKNYTKYKFTESTVISENNSIILNKFDRLSKTAYIEKDNNNIRPLLEKISGLTGKPICNFEDLQVVKYEKNNYYKPHHDAFIDDSLPNIKLSGGQRIYTILIYLNNNFEGGHTHFPKLNKKFKVKAGDAIFFNTLSKNNTKIHPKALHAGLPVTNGEKWICNIWVRENEYNNEKLFDS